MDGWVGYKVDGKTLKSVSGLFKHLIKKHAATQMSGIGADRVLTVYAGRDTVCARYACSAPCVGKAIELTAI